MPIEIPHMKNWTHITPERKLDDEKEVHKVIA
jgi:hypothetical protein